MYNLKGALNFNSFFIILIFGFTGTFQIKILVYKRRRKLGKIPREQGSERDKSKADTHKHSDQGGSSGGEEAEAEGAEF